MFYLITFFKILLTTPLKSLLFIIMAWGIVVGSVHNKKLNKLLFKDLPDDRNYFYALILNKQNKNDISRKLKRLPGIDLIKTVPQNVIQKELTKILNYSNMEEYMDNSFKQLDYQGLKVVFSSNIKNQSQNLIRDYLFRLVGKDNLTLGPVQKKAAAALKNKKPFMLLKKYGIFFIIGTCALFWILLGISYFGSFRDSTYVIENFQRRKGVCFKTVLTGMAFLFSTGFSIASISSGMDGNGIIMALLPFLFIILLHIKKGEWQH